MEESENEPPTAPLYSSNDRASDPIDSMHSNTKETRIARVFFSSPFRGLEMEREELTKKYWPRLSSMCSKAGYEFVPVDLRWGITSEKTSNAGTVEVCLREIDRSDLFVGFFGQRYGWNGVHDELLQRSFDVAATKYPWLKQYRDRSVTEIEFLHGHLNEPGYKAACFFFRDKDFDESMVRTLKSSGDDVEASKYDSNTDGANAAELLNDLKERLKETKDKCFDLVEDYPDPETGALLMYRAIKKHLERTVLAEPAKEMSDYEKDSLLHDAYYISRLGVGTRREYVGGDTYLKEVDRHVLSHVEGYVDKSLLVIGDPGFGKTTLLANWLHRHKQEYPDDVIAYHFVGCSPKSTREREVLIRLVQQLSLGFEEKGNTEKDVEVSQKSEEKNKLRERLSKLRSQKIYDIFRQLEDIIQKISDKGMRAIIIIDALNKLNPTHQTKKELYWLPTDLPKGVSLLASSLNSDTSKTKILIEDRQWDTLEVGPLKTNDRQKIIKEMLALRGKELTPSQTDMVVKKEQTANALFLKIFLQELCNFGDFWRFDEHLNFLLGANSTKELFAKILERLEADFNPPDSNENITCKVMCNILVSRYGLTDQEIKDIADIPDHLWSAIFFAMEDFFIDRAGLYAFAYDELAAAVRERYCQVEEVSKTYLYMVARHYKAKLNDIGQRHNASNREFYRIADELPLLLKKLQDKEQLKEVLSHLGVFKSLFSSMDTMYDLFDYLNFTKAPGKEIASMYMKSLDNQVALIYTQRLDDCEITLSPAKELLTLVYDIAEAISESGHPQHTEPLLQRAIRLQRYAYKKEDMYENKAMARMYIGLVNKLACIYCDLEKFTESEKLHEECLEIKERLEEKYHQHKSDIGVTLNGLALVCQRQRKYDKAMEYYHRCLEMHQAELAEDHRLIGDTYNNMGSLLFGMKKFTEAIGYLDKAVKIYEVSYFGTFHPDLAGALNNLAICYRNLKEMDKAEPLYERAYDMTIKAYGDKHPDVAEKLINWGVFHQCQAHYDTALGMYKRAMSIYKEVFGDEHIQTLFVMENISIAYILDERHEEAHPYFSKAGEVLHQQGRLDTSLPYLNQHMLNYYLNNKREDDARKLLERLMDVSFVTPLCYTLLEKLDKLLPEGERPQRPYKHTVEYAVSRFPKDVDLLKGVLELALPSGDVHRMLTVLQTGRYDCKEYNETYAECMKAGYTLDGMEILKSAIENFPDEWMTYLNLAMAHADFKEYNDALGLLRRAIEIQPSNIDLHESLGKLLVAKGDNDAARQELTIAIQLAKDDDNVRVEKINQILSQIVKDT
ncbi:TPR repeat-containing protein DDB_G0287407-like [Glandiceps talaboti]